MENHLAWKVRSEKFHLRFWSPYFQILLSISGPFWHSKRRPFSRHNISNRRSRSHLRMFNIFVFEISSSRHGKSSYKTTGRADPKIKVCELASQHQPSSINIQGQHIYSICFHYSSKWSLVTPKLFSFKLK